MRGLKQIWDRFKNDPTARRIAAIYLLLAAFNLLAWGWAIASFHAYPVLLGTAFLAYSFGLRHAVDADHIAAIDNVTRKLMQQGRKPVSVGFWFSLGHSSVVVALSLLLAAAATTMQTRFAWLQAIGQLAGTITSATFLLIVALINVAILVSIASTFTRVCRGGPYHDNDLNLLLARRGVLGHFFRGLFGLVNHGWQMYPVGLLFGLGFDTATEVGLLGISAAQAAHGMNIWAIMVFPALFAAGMSLIDTTDSVLMLNAYGWALRKPIRKLFYNLTITSVSVLVAVIVGGVELLGLARDRWNLSGAFWDRVGALNDHFGMLGYVIIAVFATCWAAAMLIYKLKRYDELEARIAE
jgi:high-affinity nickel-transport protein